MVVAHLVIHETTVVMVLQVALVVVATVNLLAIIRHPKMEALTLVAVVEDLLAPTNKVRILLVTVVLES